MPKNLATPTNVADLKTLTESADWVAAINGDSHLASVLICTSYIEQAVYLLLEKFFVDGSSTVNDLLKPTGLIGPLFNRNRLAYALGLYDEPLFKNILTIAEIRNLFAHSHVSISFDSDHIQQKCNDLTLIHDSNVIMVSVGDKAAERYFASVAAGPRVKFEQVALHVILELHVLIQKTKKRETQHTVFSPRPATTSKAQGQGDPSTPQQSDS